MTPSSPPSFQPTRIGIVGATGYVGQELVRLALQHPHLQLGWLSSKSYAGQPFSAVYPAFRGVMDAPCIADADWPAHAHEVDAILLALPHGLAAHHITPEALATGRTFIDLGADFRLPTQALYQQWYGETHPHEALLATATYGLSEWNAEAIAQSNLIANPGCYPTCTLLGLLPAVKANLIDPTSIVIDAKSGVSGAGRGVALGLQYCETNETLKAYKVASHRHTPEIEVGLQRFANVEATVSFTPHLIPMNRGMLVTTVAKLNQATTATELQALYEATYAPHPFVRVLPQGEQPETKHVRGSNYCDIAVVLDERTQRVVITSVIDNMLKGAAGQ
ncbi:MAG: N-acetyl-gamma-glutamyl-phosphate reductase, partial [Vampirovibrionales bacterium]